MIQVTDSIYIDAPVEKVYEYYTDPRHWSELAPGWMSVVCTDLKMTPDLEGSTFVSTGKMPGLPPMTESIEIVEARPNRRLVMHSDGSFGKETLTFLFEQVDAGTVLTSVDERDKTAVERVPVLGRLAEGVVNRLGAQWMHQLKAKMEHPR